MLSIMPILVQDLHPALGWKAMDPLPLLEESTRDGQVLAVPLPAPHIQPRRPQIRNSSVPSRRRVKAASNQVRPPMLEVLERDGGLRIRMADTSGPQSNHRTSANGGQVGAGERGEEEWTRMSINKSALCLFSLRAELPSPTTAGSMRKGTQGSC